MVPWADGMSSSEVTGIKMHHSGMNQFGKPFIDRNEGATIAWVREGFSKLGTGPWTMGDGGPTN